MLETIPSERVINVADIGPKYRHDILFRLFEHLAPDESLQIIVGIITHGACGVARSCRCCVDSGLFERADRM